MSVDSRRAAEALSRMREEYPAPGHYLDFEGPFQLLVATILSARCTDEKVNETTPGLFERYPGPAEMAGAPLSDLEEAVRPTGFFRNKAKAIKGASERIAEDFGGEVPADMDALTSLPGIARKSANAILQHGFGRVEGIVVDTHVVRLSRRLGWTEKKDPVKIERDLMELFDGSEWKWIPFYLKSHGRAVCTARKPKCPRCFLSGTCPSAFEASGVEGRPPGKGRGGR